MTLQVKLIMRHRPSMALRPINRIKHVIDFSGTLAKATNLNTVVAQATDTPTLGATASVETGSKINGIYLRVEIASNDPQDLGVIPQVYLTVWKNPGGNILDPNPSAVGSEDNKRFVIHQEMAMIENIRGGNPRTLFNGVVVVPKGYRRNGPNDELTVTVRSPQLDIAVCLQCHYKEFR